MLKDDARQQFAERHQIPADTADKRQFSFSAAVIAVTDAPLRHVSKTVNSIAFAFDTVIGCSHLPPDRLTTKNHTMALMPPVRLVIIKKYRKVQPDDDEDFTCRPVFGDWREKTRSRRTVNSQYNSLPTNTFPGMAGDKFTRRALPGIALPNMPPMILPKQYHDGPSRIFRHAIRRTTRCLRSSALSVFSPVQTSKKDVRYDQSAKPASIMSTNSSQCASYSFLVKERDMQFCLWST